MAPANQAFLKLTQSELCELEVWFERFEQTWSETRLSGFAQELQASNPLLARPALVELAKIDMERQWASGNRKTVEDYLREFPELGTADTVPADVIQTECEVRRMFADPVPDADLARRFPGRLDEIRRLQAVMETVAGSAATAETSGRPRTDGIETLNDCSAGHPAEPNVAAVETLPFDDRFEILDVIGEGAFGTVYRARDNVLGREVAIKVPRAEWGESGQDLAGCIDEARAAAAIDDAGICPIFDVRKFGGRDAIIMPHLKGRTLAQILADAKVMDPAEAVRLVLQLARSLEKAHQAGIVHRDLKPGNVLVTEGGQPIVMDFGLAKLVQSQSEDDRNRFYGTPAYMSPEQARCDSKQIGQSSDIYSLGVVFYQLLTGRLPFSGSVRDVLAAIADKTPAAPSSLRPGLDRRLDDICLKAMHKAPHERYASMQEFATALEAYQAAQVARKTGRRRWLMTCAALLAISLGVVIIIHSQNSTVRIEVNGPKEATIEVVPESTSSSVERAKLLRAFRGHTGVINCVAFHPDGTRFASGSSDGTVRVWDVASGEELLRFTQHGGPITRIIYSPDGRHILSCSKANAVSATESASESSVRLWDATTGEEVQRFAGHQPWTRVCVFSPDGKWILSTGQDGAVKLWDVTTRQEVREIGKHNKQSNAVAASEDFDRAVSCDSAGVVCVWDLNEGKELRRFHKHRGPLRCVAITPGGRFAASGGFDRRVRIWDLQEFHCASQLPPMKNEVKFARFSPDGRYLFAASGQSDFRLWDWRSQTLLWDRDGDTDSARAVDIAPDWKSVLSGGVDGVIRLWALPGLPEDEDSTGTDKSGPKANLH